jgi:hypothetical protein
MERRKELFKELAQINVNEYIEQKNGLNYLSWANAIQEVCRRYDEEFDYEIEKFGENKLPYVYDEGVGFMVFTNITMFGKTREMWLPVMDNNNNAMLKEPYSYQVKKYEYNPTTKKKEFMGNYEEKKVEKATMFDVNKTIMRCLTKNIAMFGLGLYIYAGEDLPVEFSEPCTAEQVKKMKDLKVNELNVCKKFRVNSLEELTFKQATFVISTKEKALETEGGKE